MSCATTNKEKVEPTEGTEEVEASEVPGAEEEAEAEEVADDKEEETPPDIDADLKENADLNAEVQGVKQDVAFIKGEFENRDAQFKSLEEKTLQSLTSLENRIAELEKNLDQTPSQKLSIKTTPLSLYEKGKNEVKDKKYRQAILSFQLLIERYPTSTLIDDAHYWIGETYFLLEDFKAAILEYDIIRKKYPQGTSVASALYNEAVCFEKLGSLKESRLLLEDLVSQFPGHPKSKMATQKLKALKKE